MPGVYYCWAHREVLLHGCERCGEYPLRNASLSLAGECGCDSGIKPLRVTSNDASQYPSLQWLAEQSAGLLTSSGTHCDDPAAALGQKAIAEASNRLGTVDYHRVADKIVNFFGEDVLRLLNVNVLVNGEPAPWICRFFYGDRGHRPTVLYLLLVGAYFDSVNDFELQASEEVIQKKSAPRKVVNANHLLQKHREAFLKLIADNSDLSRSYIQKTIPGSYDFLIRHDKEFFQSQVQRVKAKTTQRKERVDWAARDTEKALELSEFLDHEFNGGGKPVLITTASAIRKIKIVAQYRNDSLHFPKVSGILSTRLEEQDSFHKRRLRWAISEMKKTGTPISANRLRRVAGLLLSVLLSNRDVILATIFEIGAEVDARSFLNR